MKILLVGESSMLHNTLKKGLTERGHKVTLMSDGNDWHDSPRDIDLRRNMRWGKLSGLRVLWNIFSNLPKVCGNDIVQLHNYTFVPLMGGWNRIMFWFLKLTNRRIVKGCFAETRFCSSDKRQEFQPIPIPIGTISHRIWKPTDNAYSSTHVRNSYVAGTMWHTIRTLLWLACTSIGSVIIRHGLPNDCITFRYRWRFHMSQAQESREWGAL